MDNSQDNQRNYDDVPSPEEAYHQSVAQSNENSSEDSENYNRPLCKLTAKWPFDLIPDELVIQEKTVSLVRKDFISSNTETLPIRDIGRVVYTDAPFFAGLEIIGKNPDHSFKIIKASKSQAAYASQIIEGLLLQEQGMVNVPMSLSAPERSAQLAEAGKVQKNENM